MANQLCLAHTSAPQEKNNKKTVFNQKEDKTNCKSVLLVFITVHNMYVNKGQTTLFLGGMWKKRVFISHK